MKNNRLFGIIYILMLKKTVIFHYCVLFFRYVTCKGIPLYTNVLYFRRLIHTAQCIQAARITYIWQTLRNYFY